jgi:P22 tail accessory factor
MPTKRATIAAAYEELGKAIDFDLQPEDYAIGLRKLDQMLAGWATQGVRIGYAGGDGTGEVDVDMEIPGWAAEAVELNLACRLAPGIGKTPSPETKALASAAMSQLFARTIKPRPKVISGYAGSGSQYWRVPEPVPPIATGPDGVLDFGDAG